jgi:hypothetical protein
MGAPKGVCQNRHGRNEKFIDWRVFEECAKIHCTQRELCGILDVQRHTLIERTEKKYEKPFKEVYEDLKSHGKMSLRRMQFNLAKKNASMSIWLGKQWLDQKENSHTIVIDEELAGKFEGVMKAISYAQEKVAQENESTSSKSSKSRK